MRGSAENFNISSAINELLCLNTMADKAFLIVKFNAIQYYSRRCEMIEGELASVERLGECGVWNVEWGV